MKQHGVKAPTHYKFTYRRTRPRQPDVCLGCRQAIPFPGPYFWRSESGVIVICQACALTRWPE